MYGTAREGVKSLREARGVLRAAETGCPADNNGERVRPAPAAIPVPAGQGRTVTGNLPIVRNLGQPSARTPIEFQTPQGCGVFFFALISISMKDRLRVAMDAARRAGALILEFYEGDYDVRDKNLSGPDGASGAKSLRDADYDPVTRADRAADDGLRHDLRQAFPEYGWLSEETVDNAVRLQQETVWIVDPIDGTKEFLTGIPEFVVSIALVAFAVTATRPSSVLDSGTTTQSKS